MCYHPRQHASTLLAAFDGKDVQRQSCMPLPVTTKIPDAHFCVLQVRAEMEAMSEEIQELNEQVANRDEDLLNLNQELGELTDRLPVRMAIVIEIPRRGG
jgi:hypothetical protein